MLILHTSDLHLSSKDETRIKILDWIVTKANEYKSDYIVIAGDLFDSDKEATLLRPSVKDIFEKTSAEILLLPGNHDSAAYGTNYDYGKNVKQLINKPFEQFVISEIKFLAIPFQPVKFSECIMDLSEDVDILIAHGTLYDLSILQTLYQEDVEYMPIYPAEIENLCRCALLGHIHSSYIDLSYKKMRAIYPGAPVALSTKCRSLRKIALVKIDDKKLEITPISIDNTPYWQELNYFVFPDNEEEFFNKIEQEIKNLSDKKILPAVNINGYIAGNESEFKKRVYQTIEKFKGNFVAFSINCENIRSWDRLLKNPFVRKFIEKTAPLEDILRTKILELTFPHLSDIVQ